VQTSKEVSNIGAHLPEWMTMCGSPSRSLDVKASKEVSNIRGHVITYDDVRYAPGRLPNVDLRSSRKMGRDSMNRRAWP